MITSDIHIKIGEVVSIDDPEKCGRIKVLTNRFERNNSNEENLDYCYPLLSQLIHILPKVGEAVIVLFTSSSGSSNKYYIGPIISQPHKMQEDNYYKGAINIFKDGSKLDNPNYENGTFCENEDVALYGRKGCELILKDDDIRLQCGIRIGKNDQFKESFNTLSPAYLKMKYYQNEQRTSNKNINLGEDNVYQSTATLVADEINLLSNSNANNYKLNSKNGDLITDEDMQKIIAEAHVLPFGDKLVDFLSLFLKAFQQHSHPYPNIPTILPSGFPDIYNTDLTQLLSKHVRIN
jgi:hypothetical protein